MIVVQDIVNACLFELQAEDSDRYKFDSDFKPAINLTQKWLVSLYNRLFGEKKVSEESLRELHKLRVYQTSQFSRVVWEDDADPQRKLWTITGVYPEITKTTAITLDTTDPTGQSKIRKDSSVLDIVKSANRLSIEEWGEKTNNPMVPGYPHTNAELVEYAYLNVLHAAMEYTASDVELFIAPDVKNTFIGISYLISPIDITTIDDTLEFPESLLGLTVDKVLHYIAIKEDDTLPLYTVTQTEINNAIALLS